MLLGILNAILLLLTVIKFATKRLPYRKLDLFAMKVHKPAAVLLLAVSVIHTITVWKLLQQRPIAMFIIGIIMTLSIAATIVSRIRAKSIGKNWIKLHRAFTIITCICLLAHVWLGVSSFSKYQKAISTITIENVQLSQVADGTYEGEYDAGYIYAKVAVTVDNGKLSDVVILEHRKERGAPAEKITEDIVSKQTLLVDAVSGATNSSEVLLKATENALKKGLIK